MHKILATTWIIGIAVAIGFGLFSLYNIGHPTDVLGADLRVLFPVQGGTGISTSSPTDVGKCIKVLSDSPFKYTIGSCGGAGGDPTVVQVDGATQSAGTPTLNFTNNSFAVTENPADTFLLRVSTSTLGLLSSSISDFVSTVRSSITESVLGLTFTTGNLSLDSGYTIPTTTRAVNWDTAFSWGNHATQGYITDGNTNWDNSYGFITNTNWLYNGSRLSPSTTVGIGVFASSTIGDGTGTGGLTINGGATTTGTNYFKKTKNGNLITLDNGGNFSGPMMYWFDGYGDTGYIDQYGSIGASVSGFRATPDGSVAAISIGNGTTGNGQNASIVTTHSVGIASNTPSRLLTVQGDGYFLNNITAASSTLGNATSTTLGSTGGVNFFGGGLKTTSNSFCIQLTGSADLCDGVDGGGAGGSSNWMKNADLSAITPTTTVGIIVNASSSIDSLFVRNGTTTNATSTNLFSALGTFTNLVVNTLSTFLNVVVTGLLDVGGGVLEIPNGTAPVIDSIGEIGIDSTDDQLILADGAGTARVFGTDEFRVVSLTMASSSLQFDSGDLLAVLGNKDGLEITQFRCYVVGGTSKVVNLTDGTNDTETITCATTMTSDTDVATNDTFTADEIGSLEMGATTGTVNYLHFEAWARITRE